MPVFEYSGLTETGKSVRGLKDAENRKALRLVLRKDGIFLTDARSAEGAAAVAAAGRVEAFSGQGLSREVDLPRSSARASPCPSRSPRWWSRSSTRASRRYWARSSSG